MCRLRPIVAGALASAAAATTQAGKLLLLPAAVLLVAAPTDAPPLTALARALLAAEACLAKGEDPAFLKAKIATARFYAEHILSRAGGIREAVVEGADSVNALAAEAF